MKTESNLLLFSLFLLLSNIDGAALCNLADRVGNVFNFAKQSNTCSIKELSPIFHFGWNVSSVNISKTIESHQNLANNKQQYVIQYSNSNKRLWANAVVETVVYPTGYELYYDGTLFLTRVQIAVKTRQIGQEFLSEVSYTSAAYKAIFNMSMNSDQIWFSVSKGDEHYTLSAAKIGDKWVFGYQTPSSTKDVISGFLITLNSMLRGIVHINLPEASLHWSGGLILEEFSNGGRILVNLGGNQTTLNSTWSNNNTTYRLTSQAGQYYSEPFFLLDLNSSFINSVWQLDMDIASPFFDWRWVTNLTKSGQSNQRLIEVASRVNYFQQPISRPITYLLGYRESNQSRLLDLRHNITSELYQFEGNLTVDLQSTGEVITAIHQKAASSLSRLFYLELKQIFHQMITSFWETVVMKTDLVNMHVTGRWEQSIFNFYRKQFVFYSLIEELLPSITINLQYSNSRQFLHEILFPFLARKLIILVDWHDEFQRLCLSDLDLFLSNETTNILEISRFQSEQVEIVKLISDAKLDHCLDQLTKQLSKIYEHSMLVCENVHHPLNQLLRPILRKPTICQFWNDTLLLTHSLFQEISLMYKMIHF